MPRTPAARRLANLAGILRAEFDQRAQRRLPHMPLIPEREHAMRQPLTPPAPSRRTLHRAEHPEFGPGIFNARARAEAEPIEFRLKARQASRLPGVAGSNVRFVRGSLGRSG